MNIDAYNFDDKHDLINFIQNLLDGYCPTQLSKIDSDLVYDAIHGLKDEKLELTGNAIYSDAVYLGVVKTDQQIKNWRDYLDENELTNEQISIVDSFANKIETEAGLLDSGIITCFANGSLDSSVHWSTSISNETVEAINIIMTNSDIFNDLSNKISLDLEEFNITYNRKVDVEMEHDY